MESGWSKHTGQKPTISILPLPQSSLLQETHLIGRHRHLTNRKTVNCNCQNTHPLKYQESNPPPIENPNPKHHCTRINQIAELPTSALPPCGVDPRQRTSATLQKPTSPICASPPFTEPALSCAFATLFGETEMVKGKGDRVGNPPEGGLRIRGASILEGHGRPRLELERGDNGQWKGERPTC
jgi:hypothetical protein